MNFTIAVRGESGVRRTRESISAFRPAAATARRTGRNWKSNNVACAELANSLPAWGALVRDARITRNQMQRDPRLTAILRRWLEQQVRAQGTIQTKV